MPQNKEAAILFFEKYPSDIKIGRGLRPTTMLNISPQMFKSKYNFASE